MKKVLKWMGIAVLTPLLLFIILAALLYLPPVQNWVVQKVTAIASEKTGTEISIGHVNLEFPLDLGIDDFRVLHQNDSVTVVTDTIADIKKLVVDVKLLPLLKKRVVIEELSLQQAKIKPLPRSFARGRSVGRPCQAPDSPTSCRPVRVLPRPIRRPPVPYPSRS